VKQEEEIPRELAEFIPAISARRARRFDARADFSAERKRWERATDPRGEESCSRVGATRRNIFCENLLTRKRKARYVIKRYVILFRKKKI
jgi:hypothetical protein